MIELQAIGYRARTDGRQWVYALCDKDRPRENTGLIGETVKAGGTEFVVHGVESFAMGGPIKAGSRIGLLVSLKRDGET